METIKRASNWLNTVLCLLKIQDRETIKTYFRGMEHYRFLADLSHDFSGHTVYDIGSYRGLSAVALSANPRCNVISYDIVDLIEVNTPPNVTFKIGNFFDDPDILKSPLIMFDVDPHDGVIEHQFLDWLIEKEYTGMVVFDDIHLNPEMSFFWNRVRSLVDTVDVTDTAHWSGTGVAFFKGKNN